MDQFHRRKGFTLIELLVVIAIIALLLAVILPSLQKAKERARELVCKSNLRQIALALRLYLDENNNTTYDFDKTHWEYGDGFFWFDAAGNYLDPRTDYSYWGLAYIDYAGTPKIFGCPSFMRVAELIYAVDPKLIQNAAYGLNYNFIDLKVKEIRSPSQYIVATDHVEPKSEDGSLDMFHNDGPGELNLKDFRLGGPRAAFYRGIFRHNIRFSDPFRTGGRAGVLWLDMHVSSLDETTGDDVPERWYTGK